MIIKSGIVEDIFKNPGPWHYAVINDYYINIFEVVDWCLDSFGIDSFYNWCVSADRTAFFFKNHDDFIMFVLRWS